MPKSTGLTAFLSGAQPKSREKAVETISIESSEDESDKSDEAQELCDKCKTRVRGAEMAEHRDWHVA